MTYFNLDVGKTGSSEQSRPAPSSALLIARLGEAASEVTLPLCATCSTQTSQVDKVDLDSQDAPFKCPICLDPRQYIGIKGQKWTTLERLIERGELRNDFEQVMPDQLWTFKTRPSFGIGQRAFLMKDEKSEGLIMWDCVAYIDDATLKEIDAISQGKGLAHMIISHPHYYSTTATWLAAFPKMKLWLAGVDFREWYQRQDTIKSVTAGKQPRVELVDEEQTYVAPSLSSAKILLLGGHFPGSLVLLWKDCLFIADTIQVVPSGLYKSDQPQRPNVASVTFLWSYPNQIPLSATEIQRVCRPLEKVQFDKAFGAFEGFDIWGHARDKILQSRDIFCRRLATT
ncbi:hypothetical protein IE81DRAFT_49071 [Ceraceosorus guamensis]|uniref:Metallo-beta-lactamase domain-containing protein n=1 Tax=Ceraceosorus guamensis TaxID=1522189 RepID=A0A316VPX4_9BASI|nr:hypothetical protein IE81DRAFT_49071 [Ceraceosorus guamensis]PWN39128.1 hypothetical protein IE81DRAFT_49071 [Ceraceosorus guamensis]